MTSGIKPPDRFDFKEPGSWTQWRDQFRKHRLITELTEKSGEIQVASLVYIMGPEADRIFNQLTLTDEQRKQFADVEKAFTEYFMPKRNIIHERAVFHRCNQQIGETIQEYVRALHDLAETAEFTDKDTTIRDRLFLGVQDSQLSEKLQLEADLTLHKTITIARQQELVKNQLQAQRHSSEEDRDVHVAFLQRGRGRSQQQRRGGQSNRGQFTPRGSSGARGGERNAMIQDCRFCAGTHVQRRCPAYSKQCKKCGEMNHFARSRMCKGKASLNCVQREENDDDEEDLDEAYVMAVDRKKNTGAWTIDIDLHNKQATFKIDTGADVSVIPVSFFNTMQPKPKLIPTRTVLRSPGGVLDCRGTIRVDAKVRGKKYNLKLML
ncbi:hypothetical protein ACOMHN_042852 [Nucella lapillus]